MKTAMATQLPITLATKYNLTTDGLLSNVNIFSSLEMFHYQDQGFEGEWLLQSSGPGIRGSQNTEECKRNMCVAPSPFDYHLC